MKKTLPYCLLSSSLLVGCGQLGMFKAPEFKNPNERKWENVSKDDVEGYEQYGAAGSPGKFVAKFTNNEIEDIHANVEWAPEDPDTPFNPGLSVGGDTQHYSWTQNYKAAIQRSRKEGKPLLIWFSDSKGSAISKRLSQQLFERSDFEAWMNKKFSPLIVDKGSVTTDDSRALALRKKKYYEAMVKRFSVMGSPEVLVLDSKGNVHARYRGFSKGDAELYWGRLKVAHAGAVASYGAWREKMEEKGYRVWHSVEGEEKVFAKMVSQTEEEISLVTPEGRTQTHAKTHFCLLDRNYMQQQASQP